VRTAQINLFDFVSPVLQSMAGSLDLTSGFFHLVTVLFLLMIGVKPRRVFSPSAARPVSVYLLLSIFPPPHFCFSLLQHLFLFFQRTSLGGRQPCFSSHSSTPEDHTPCGVVFRSLTLGTVARELPEHLFQSCSGSSPPYFLLVRISLSDSVSERFASSLASCA